MSAPIASEDELRYKADLPVVVATGPLNYNETNIPERAKNLVSQFVLSNLEKTDPIPHFIVYVVWFTKTLQNWKAMVSTTLPDGMYYELTYNGDKGETYLDAYKKFHKVTIKD